jgi:hypothetical protein
MVTEVTGIITIFDDGKIAPPANTFEVWFSAIATKIKHPQEQQQQQQLLVGGWMAYALFQLKKLKKKIVSSCHVFNQLVHQDGMSRGRKLNNE